VLRLDPKLVIVDTLTSLFSVEYTGPSLHVAIMHHLHELSLLAINLDCAVVVTNMVRNTPITLANQRATNIATAFTPSEQREFIGTSVSIYSHMKLKLEIRDPSNATYKALLIQPPGKEAKFTITRKGISD